MCIMCKQVCILCYCSQLSFVFVWLYRKQIFAFVEKVSLPGDILHLESHIQVTAQYDICLRSSAGNATGNKTSDPFSYTVLKYVKSRLDYVTCILL